MFRTFWNIKKTKGSKTVSYFPSLLQRKSKAAHQVPGGAYPVRVDVCSTAGDSLIQGSGFLIEVKPLTFLGERLKTFFTLCFKISKSPQFYVCNWEKKRIRPHMPVAGIRTSWRQRKECTVIDVTAPGPDLSRSGPGASFPPVCVGFILSIMTLSIHQSPAPRPVRPPWPGSPWRRR